MKNHRYFRIKEKSFQITNRANEPTNQTSPPHPASLNNDSTPWTQGKGDWSISEYYHCCIILLYMYKERNGLVVNIHITSTGRPLYWWQWLRLVVVVVLVALADR